eukprot:8499003-Pyramimonas_sp.AAC.1
MESALAQAKSIGWVLSWQAARRRLNKAADSLATQGVFLAVALRNAGDAAVHADVQWAGAHSALPARFPI